MNRESKSPETILPLDDDRDVNIADLGRSLLDRWRLFLAVTVGVVAVVMLVTLLIPPVYESEGVLRVRSDDPDSGMLDDLLPIAGVSLPGLASADVETEIGILRSRRIADLVADSVALHVDLVRPRGERRTDILSAVRADEDAVVGVYSFSLVQDGRYTLAYDGDDGPVTIPESVRIGEPIDVGNMRLTLHPQLQADPPDEIRLRVRPFQRVVTRLRDDLYIARQDSRSQLIDLSYRHRDPRIAAAVVNGFIAYFVDYSKSSEQLESRRKSEILAEQVSRYQTELREAEDRLQRFQEQERIVAPEEQATQQVRRIAEVQMVHDALQVERAAIATLIDRIGTSRADTNEPAYRQLAGFPSFISNGAVQNVLESLTDLENQRAELLGRRTAANEDVQVLDSRIGELENQLFNVGANYLQGLEHQIASAATTLRQFGSDLESIPAVEVEYARLVRDERLLSEVYLLLEGRLRETNVQEAIDDASVRVIDNGPVMERAAFPRPLVSFVLATALGLMSGLFAVFSAEAIKPAVRSRRDAERATGGVPVVGVIPSPARRLVRKGAGTANGGGRLLSRGANVDGLVARSDPWHPASEAYRALALSFLTNGAARPGIVVVTTPLLDDGKSDLAANLAVSFARSGVRTLLLDADLRQRRLSKMLGPSSTAGWPDVVLAGGKVEESIVEVPSGDGLHSPLHLLPAGTSTIHPAEIIGAPATRALFDDLRARYEAVIVDTPALESGMDATTLAALADATMLVIRSGSTSRDTVEHATAELASAGAPLTGVVLVGHNASSR